MRGSEDGDILPAALDGLSALVGPEDRSALAELRDRLQQMRLRVLVAGEAKRGKSTLVNALLGRQVLPSGVTPLTSLATAVRYGPDEGVTAVFRDGRAESYPLSALDDLVTERGNPDNRRGLASVTVTVDAPVLARGIELVGTPGTGSVYAHNTAEAELALETMDAADRVRVRRAGDLPDHPVHPGSRHRLPPAALTAGHRRDRAHRRRDSPSRPGRPRTGRERPPGAGAPAGLFRSAG